MFTYIWFDLYGTVGSFPKINMPPETGPFQKEHRLPTIISQGKMLVFGGVIITPWILWEDDIDLGNLGIPPTKILPFSIFSGGLRMNITLRFFC